MIIACYAGVGKSTFAKRYPEETMDLYSMPFSWILPEKTDGEFENVKAAPYLLRNPAFPDNYIAAILENEQKYKYVLIPTIEWVLRRLYCEYKMPYVICYPRSELKEEYRNRYIARGNTLDFMDVFTEQWEDRISSLMQDRSGSHIQLGSGQFLTDVKDKIDRIIESADTKPGNIAWRNMEITELNQMVEITMQQGCVWIMNYDPHYYFKLDLRNPDNRKWVYELGKACYEKGIQIYVDDFQMLETFYDHEHGSDPAKIQEFTDKQEVTDYLDAL